MADPLASSTPALVRTEPLPPRSWPAVMARAIVMLLFGAAALAWPRALLDMLALFVAAFLLVNGLFAVVCGIRETLRQRRSGTMVFEGAVGIVAGVLALLWPAGTLLALVWLAALWGILAGASLVATAVRRGPHRGRVLLALAGVMAIIWGFLLVVAPAAGALVLAAWLGAFAILFGAALLAASLRLRKDAVEDEFGMAVA